MRLTLSFVVIFCSCLICGLPNIQLAWADQAASVQPKNSAGCDLSGEWQLLDEYGNVRERLGLTQKGIRLKGWRVDHKGRRLRVSGVIKKSELLLMGFYDDVKELAKTLPPEVAEQLRGITSLLKAPILPGCGIKEAAAQGWRVQWDKDKKVTLRLEPGKPGLEKKNPPTAYAMRRISQARILEDWGPDSLAGWEAAPGGGMALELGPSPAGEGRALYTRTAGGDCRPVYLRKEFTLHHTEAYNAYLEAYLVFNSDEAEHTLPHIRVELLDDQGKILGKRSYYGQGIIGQKFRNHGVEFKELPLAGGIVRIKLHLVNHDNTSFSRIAVNIGHDTCDGQSELVVGKLIFCPGQNCALMAEEKEPDPEAVLKELMDLVAEEDPMYGYMESLIPPIRLAPTTPPVKKPGREPGSQAAGYPLLASAFDSGRASDAGSLRLAAAVTGPECNPELDRFVAEKRRISMILGEQAHLKEALANFGKTLLAKLKFKTPLLEKMRDMADQVVDSYDILKTVGEDVKRDNYGDAALDLSRLILKRLLDQMGKGKHLGDLSSPSHRIFQTYLKSLPDEKRDMAIDSIKIMLRDQGVDLKRFKLDVDSIKKMESIDWGKVLGQLSAGQRNKALLTALETVGTTFSPKMAILKAAVDLVKKSALAARNYVADGQIQEMYADYKKTKSGDDRYDMTWWENRIYENLKDRSYRNQAIEKTREVMEGMGQYCCDPATNKIKVIDPALLQAGGGPTPRELGRIPDRLAKEFLLRRFNEWHRAEQKVAKKGDRFSEALDHYRQDRGLCTGSYLDGLVWPDGRPRGLAAVGQAWAKFWDKCYLERERFKKYAQVYLQTRNALSGYRQIGPCATKGGFSLNVHQIACARVTSPYDREEAYKEAFTRTLEECGWLPKGAKAYRKRLKKRIARRLRSMSPRKVEALLIQMNRVELLNCLCSQLGTGASYGSYDPQGKNCKRSGDNDGLCSIKGFGCGRGHPPLSPYHLGLCGAVDEISDYVFGQKLIRYGEKKAREKQQ
jgi:hypothetical protein